MHEHLDSVLMYMYYVHMTYTTTTMSEARANFAELLDNAAEQITVIKRRGKKDVAIFDIDLIEDYLASQNPRIIKKIADSRKSNKLIELDDLFKD